MEVLWMLKCIGEHGRLKSSNPFEERGEKWRYGREQEEELLY